MTKNIVTAKLTMLKWECNSHEYRLIELNTIDSTNTYLKHNLPEQCGVIVSAESQTSGRGRLERKWLNTGNQLLFSFSAKSTLQNVSFISLVAGLAVYSVLSEFQPEIRLKWPNDILFRGKKICGILCESVANSGETYIIVGIGINLSKGSETLPAEISKKAGFLTSENDFVNPSKRDIKCGIYNHFMKNFKALENQTVSKQQLIETWLSHSDSPGKRIQITDGGKNWCGIFHSLDENGFIQLLGDDGRLTTFRTGDVEFI